MTERNYSIKTRIKSKGGLTTKVNNKQLNTNLPSHRNTSLIGNNLVADVADADVVQECVKDIQDDMIEKWFMVHNETTGDVFSESEYRPAYAVAALVIISRLS